MEGARPRPPRTAGHTLQEALIALAAAAVVVVGVIPTGADILARERVRAAVNEFVATLHAARTAAVQRGRRAVLCPSADHASCLAAPLWERGWIVFVDEDGDRERDADEPLLLARGALRGLRVRSSAGRRRIVYNPRGFAYGTNLTVRFCPDGRADDARVVVVSNPGRPRVAPAPAGACH